MNLFIINYWQEINQIAVNIVAFDKKDKKISEVHYDIFI